ncbi:MAG: hypothetical protein COB67_12580 [SAR324 cluster bacterium]|uniref:HD/PDEase domain-containing protein n=1 Tax=SAR324 cluster bacterium TaxID=2024889 RepID=A0A2A4SR86_9DELT|nr:MAG: hypothetical protein COB67_12580 [SAR324 cluster bacterium]
MKNEDLINSKIQNLPNISTLWKQRVLEKTILLLALCAIIGYLLSPKIIFQPTVYDEGDIIRQTIIVDEDILIRDRVSTRLKREQLLKETRTPYDFDPNILGQTNKLIHRAFQTIRSQFVLLKKENKEIAARQRNLGKNYFYKLEEQELLAQKIRFYDDYKELQEERLEKLAEGGQLSTKGFSQKQKLDVDLNSANLILNDLLEKESLLEKEIGIFPTNFRTLAQEIKIQSKSIENRQISAILNFIKTLHLDVNDKELDAFQFDFYQKEVEDQLLNLMTRVLMKKVILSKALLQEEKSLIEVRNLVSGETTKNNSINSFVGLEEARALIKRSIEENLKGNESGKIKTFLILISHKLIRPTITANKQIFERRKEAITAEMSPVFFSLKKGEIIARTGDRITRHQAELIRGYYSEISNIDQIPKTIGFILVALISFSLVYLSFQVRDEARLTFKSLLLMATAIVISMLLVKGGALVGKIIETQYIGIQDEIYQYMLPVALSSMLVGILINFEAGLLAGLLTSLFVSIMQQGNLFYFAYAMMGSLVAALPVTNFTTRHAILIHGLKISAINLPMMFVIYLIEANQLDIFIWANISSALLGGLVTAIIVSVLLPFFESLFDVTTNIKLLELSNMHHPALKDLIFQAPGTYQHSIIVGNLAEAAAHEINANALLARVASYYHDIGKGVESHYFIENKPQQAKNIHDEMDPYVSAQAIIDHLKKGAEIADRHRLGSAIKDILLQHHGTGLVKFFYHKAKAQAKEQDSSLEVDPSRFRYLGPKPQSLEAGLVMLADAAEASTRSLDNPTPESISKMVNKVGWGILEDKQLDESGMTLKKFRQVMDTFTTVLTSIHHHRIKYPEENTIDYENVSRHRQ